jgi:hypothetical protein
MNRFDIQRGTYGMVAPLGTSDVDHCYEGRAQKKPWDYPLTAVIPHLDAIEPLRACLDILRLQTLRPYLLVIDTGSAPEVLASLEMLRAEDCEIHYVAGHGYRHSSEPVAVALDLAHSLCRTKLLFHTHLDCFLRRRDFLESLARTCNADTAAIGYRMSPRDWITSDWQWMVGHVALMLYMPTMHRIGATWSIQRLHYAYGYEWKIGQGWPDTETGFNHVLRDAGIQPVFIGEERNFARQVDDNLDHARSFTGSQIYAAELHQRSKQWMEDAMREAQERIALWSAPPTLKPRASFPNLSTLTPL